MKFFYRVISLLAILSLLCGALLSCEDKKIPVVGDTSERYTDDADKEDEDDPAESTSVSVETELQEESKVPSGAEYEPHVHSTPGGRWRVDLEGHWRECACSQKYDAGEHTIVNSVCTVCHASVTVFDGNRTAIRLYNDRNDMLLDKLYDREANELYSLEFFYTYNDFGIKLTEKATKNGIIFYERTYDENGNVVSRTRYDSAGIPITD